MRQHDDSFTLLMERFDRIEALLDGHIAKDEEDHAIIRRHETYWTIVKAFSIPVILGAIAWLKAKFFP